MKGADDTRGWAGSERSFEVPPIIVVAGATQVDLRALAAACDLGGPIIAADSGANHVLDADHMPDIVIGDLDSIGDGISRLAATTEIEQYPRDKDAIDLELAVERAARLVRATDSKRSSKQDEADADALETGPEIWIFAAFGGRLDHSFANLLLATRPEFLGLRITFFDGLQRVWPVQGPARLSIVGSPGDRVSILPIRGPIQVRRTEGLRWPLREEALSSGTTRGVSNEMRSGSALVDVVDGVALIVHLAEA